MSENQNHVLMLVWEIVHICFIQQIRRLDLIFQQQTPPYNVFIRNPILFIIQFTPEQKVTKNTTNMQILYFGACNIMQSLFPIESALYQMLTFYPVFHN